MGGPQGSSHAAIVGTLVSGPIAESADILRGGAVSSLMMDDDIVEKTLPQYVVISHKTYRCRSRIGLEVESQKLGRSHCSKEPATRQQSVVDSDISYRRFGKW